MTYPTISKKSDQRDKMAADVAAFLSGGGEIQEIGTTKITKVFLPSPENAITESIQTRAERRLKSAMKGAKQSAIARKSN